MNKLVRKNKKGFTLTEMIVVIAIIGILAAVMIPSVIGYITYARRSAASQEANAILDVYENYQTAVEAGLLENGTTFTSYYQEVTEKNLKPQSIYIEYVAINDGNSADDVKANAFVYISDSMTVVINLESSTVSYENKDYVNEDATLFTYQETIDGSTNSRPALRFKEIDWAD